MLVVSVGMSSVSASYSDTTFNRNLNGSIVYTDHRLKEDTSSSYMKCLSAEMDYTADVFGSNSASGGEVDCSYVNGAYRQYSFTTGVTHKMLNCVKDGMNYYHQYKYGCIRMIANHNWPYTVSGVWSPDSI
jgi:hypothetical protein